MPRLFRRLGVAGAVRRGVKGDIRLVLADERPEQDKEPLLERPAALINSVRFYGEREGDTPAEAMTATSAALYEFLMASARLEMKDRAEHMVPFSDAKAYLKIEKASRLREYMDALASTWVSYDFQDVEDGFQRIGRRVQLMQCEEAVARDGTRYIAFSMHPSVRKAILGAGHYALLELGAFPMFASKYTSRLYPKLALMAGRKMRPPMRWTPEELAAEFGWMPSGNFKFSNFEARVLLPVLNDIERHVRRFGTTCEYRRADTRGRPVSQIIITVGPATRAPDEIQKAPMSRKDRGVVREIAKKAAVDIATQMPGEDALRRAATRLRKPVTEVATMWTDYFGNPLVVDNLERNGLIPTFEEWLKQREREIDDADEVEFDDAGTVILLVADGYGTADVDVTLLSAIGDHLWTGAKTKTLRLLWSEEGQQHQREVTVAATERDLALFVRANADFIEDMEYVA